MRIVLLVFSLVLSSQIANAQFIKEKYIHATIGYGLSAPYESADNIVDSGLFLQGEVVLKAFSWMELRPYTGLIITNSSGTDIDENPTEEKAETKAFLMGGKVRLKAPIPYVKPYVELGIGTSIGKFETATVFFEKDKSGILYHIPFSIGIELWLNKKSSFDIGLLYFFQPEVRQYVGAFAVGVSFQPQKWR